MNKINIYSNKDFLLEINLKNYYIDDLNSIEITDFSDPIFAKVYPINQSKLSIPFCIKLYTQNKTLLCDSKCCKIYNLKDRYDVFISPFLIGSNICLYTQTHTVKNIKYTVCCYEDRIKITSTKGEYTYEVIGCNFSSVVENNHIFILCKEKIKHLIAFNCTNNTFCEIQGHQIEIENNSIKSLQHINDISKHSVVCSYKVDTNIELVSTDLYTQNTNIQKIFTKEIFVYNFFEAIKINDFKLANSLLHPDLKNTLSENTLKNYFGNFEHIKLYKTEPLTFTLYNIDTAKDYEITLKENLISDIEES